MSPRPRHSETSASLSARIIATAWKQISNSGAAALSLRSIARELGITAPAIYHYYPSRDALVTALIVDAFTSFGEMLEASIRSVSAENHAQRLRALGLAYRRWAVEHPERYQLIFGTPIAGYVAPVEITSPAAARSLETLVSVLAGAHQAGLLREQENFPLTSQLASMLEDWQSGLASMVPVEVLYLGLVIWGRVHGLVSLEIGNQFPPFITDAGEVYRREIERIVQQTVL